MILNKKPLNLAEVESYVKGMEDKKEMTDYLKKFVKLKRDKALALTDEIRGLNNPKIKEEDIVKLADLLPEDLESVNKIFTEVSLTEEEANAILEIIGRY